MTETPGKQPQGGGAGSSAPGADAPSLEELARRLLDLWQDQLTAVAANPDLATQAARLMAAMPLPGMWLSQLGQMGSGPLGAGRTGADTDMTKIWAKMAQDWMAQDWSKGGPAHAGTGQPAATAARPADISAGAAPAAATFGSGSRDLDELGRRLAGIEQRLGELSQQSPKRQPAAKPKAASKPRRTRAADKPGGSGSPDGGAAG